MPRRSNFCALFPLIFLIFFLGTTSLNAEEPTWEICATTTHKSAIPFLSNYSLGQIEIFVQKKNDEIPHIVMTTNIRKVAGTTNIRKTWGFEVTGTFFPSLKIRTNFSPPPALLEIFGKERTRLLKENDSLTISRTKLSPQNLEKIVLYTAAKSLSVLEPAKTSSISSIEEILSIKKILDEVSNLQANLSKGQGLGTPGYFQFYYPSSVSKKEESFEILVPKISGLTNMKQRQGDKRENGKRDEKTLRLIYYLGDDEFSAKEALSYLNSGVNLGGPYALVKGKFRSGSSELSRENKKLFEELRGIIETGLSVKKECVYLASTLDSLTALSYQAYAPSRYAASGMFEYSGRTRSEGIETLSRRLEGSTKSFSLLLSSKDKSGSEDLLSTTTNLLSVGDLSRRLTNVFFDTESVSYSVKEVGATLPTLLRYFDTKESLPAPANLSFTILDAELDGPRYYLSIEKLIDPKKPGKIGFSFSGDTADVTTVNVEAFSIDLSYPLFQKGNRFIVSLNGTICLTEFIKGFSHVLISDQGRSYYLR